MDLNQPKKFNVGEPVFVKVRGYPHWPAKIEGITDEAKYNVTFCGTNEPGMVKLEDIFSYQENKDKFKEGSTSKSFLKGIKELEDNMMSNGDPWLVDSDKDDDTDEFLEDEDVEIDEQVKDTDSEDDRANAKKGSKGCSSSRKSKKMKRTVEPSKLDVKGNKKKRRSKN